MSSISNEKLSLHENLYQKYLNLINTSKSIIETISSYKNINSNSSYDVDHKTKLSRFTKSSEFTEFSKLIELATELENEFYTIKSIIYTLKNPKSSITKIADGLIKGSLASRIATLILNRDLFRNLLKLQKFDETQKIIENNDPLYKFFEIKDITLILIKTSANTYTMHSLAKDFIFPIYKYIEDLRLLFYRTENLVKSISTKDLSKILLNCLSFRYQDFADQNLNLCGIIYLLLFGYSDKNIEEFQKFLDFLYLANKENTTYRFQKADWEKTKTVLAFYDFFIKPDQKNVNILNSNLKQILIKAITNLMDDLNNGKTLTSKIKNLVNENNFFKLSKLPDSTSKFRIKLNPKVGKSLRAIIKDENQKTLIKCVNLLDELPDITKFLPECLQKQASLLKIIRDLEDICCTFGNTDVFLFFYNLIYEDIPKEFILRNDFHTHYVELTNKNKLNDIIYYGTKDKYDKKKHPLFFKEFIEIMSTIKKNIQNVIKLINEKNYENLETRHFTWNVVKFPSKRGGMFHMESLNHFYSRLMKAHYKTYMENKNSSLKVKKIRENLRRLITDFALRTTESRTSYYRMPYRVLRLRTLLNYTVFHIKNEFLIETLEKAVLTSKYIPEFEKKLILGRAKEVFNSDALTNILSFSVLENILYVLSNAGEIKTEESIKFVNSRHATGSYRINLSGRLTVKEDERFKFLEIFITEHALLKFLTGKNFLKDLIEKQTFNVSIDEIINLCKKVGEKLSRKP